MKSFANLFRSRFRGFAQASRAEKLVSMQVDKSTNQGNTVGQQTNMSLKKLNQYMEFHKYSKAIKEIDRLASEKVDFPVQDILKQLVRNSEFEMTNKLYDILQKTDISLSDISYIYLIDANLKQKNCIPSINIAIHAYLAGVVLDMEVYRGLFSCLPADIDSSYRLVLYKLYREHFQLTPRLLNDLIIQTSSDKDQELQDLLEQDSEKFKIQIPETLKKMINKPSSPKQKLKEFEDEDILKEQISIQGEKAFANSSFISEDFIQGNGEANSLLRGQLPINNLEEVGGDVLRFIKRGQTQGVFSQNMQPLIFVMKSSAENDQYGEFGDDESDILNGRGEDQGEGLNSYSDEESD